MATKTSAGLLLFKKTSSGIEVLLAHPGGPFFAKKDQGVWTIPKGEIDSDKENLLERAKIEFEEELGIKAVGDAIPLGSITQKGGKIVHGWAIEGDLPADFEARSNTFQLEWPPRSGKIQSFPEVDRAAFFSLDEAARKIKSTQQPFLHRLLDFVQTRDCSG